MRVFETRTATGREHFARQDSGVFQCLIISHGEKILSNAMCLCEDKLKGKTAHFRLPSASQKRACLSSLLWAFDRDLGTARIHYLKSEVFLKIRDNEEAPFKIIERNRSKVYGQT